MRLTVSVEATEILRAFDRVGDRSQDLLLAEAEYTANAIVVEARARVRKLTGQTMRGIHSEPSEKGDGFVVFAYDTSDASSRGPVDFWLEFGTKHMTAKPFFFNAGLMEEGPYLRRVGEALQAAIDEAGLS